MVTNLSHIARNAAADAVTALTRTIEIYSAPMPVLAGAKDPACVLLASFALIVPAFTAAVDGVASFSGPVTTTSVGAGDAAWARFLTPGGATVFDLDVGTTTQAVVLNRVDMVVGQTIEIASGSYTQPATAS